MLTISEGQPLVYHQHDLMYKELAAVSGLCCLGFLIWLVVFGASSSSVSIRNFRANLLSPQALRYAGYLAPAVYFVSYVIFIWLFESQCLPYFEGTFTRIYIRILYLLPLVSLYAGLRADPGIITSTNHASVMQKYLYDNILYTPGIECRTCKFVKPARSKHCSVCNACIALCDHHCVWLNRCVGQDNARTFYGFVLVNLWVPLHGLAFCVHVLRILLADYDGNQELNTIVKLRHLFSDNDAARAGICISFMSLCLLLIGGFYIQHLLCLVHQGATSNESDKWQDVAELIAERSLYTYKPSEYPAIVLQKRHSGSQGDSSFNRKLLPREKDSVEKNNARLAVIESFDDIDNIYDQGFKQNLFTVLAL